MKKRTVDLYKICYWTGHKNLGDELSLYLAKKITGNAFSYQAPPFNENTLVAIGSLIHPLVMQNKAIIWGTGTLSEKCLDPLPLRNLRFPVRRIVGFLTEYCQRKKALKMMSQPDIRAVRGPKTRKILLEKGFNCCEVYGDPAILLPEFYTPKRNYEKSKIGIILHHSQNKRIAENKINRGGGLD